ncbi:uncharacterized protein LOC108436987 isoform X2 [Pygocentrus nattereri]|uniref:uncharacterized protein LOC108436987 isoform X2 n=1 Tax=Pygocentrus nattereri TaxID=42514 RepID=UPI0008145A53|nr:uncharacterized protein LOC108436987 isoform X2 [Pygocentrus nattereri]
MVLKLPLMSEACLRLWSTMPTKQLRRRHATAGICDHSFVPRGPDAVDRLAFKYMMCKVDSSSDSESDVSPRWSDASSKSLQLCTSLKKPSLPQKPFGRHYQQSLDPYDGSSEDSTSSADGSKRQKHRGFRTKGRGRRAAPNPAPLFEVRRPGSRDGMPADVQMRSSSDSELKADNQGDFPPSARKFANAEILQKPLYCPVVPFGRETFHLTDDLLKSPTHLGSPSKRKLFGTLADSEEYMHRKKQCITQMETETIFPEYHLERITCLKNAACCHSRL